MSCLPVFLLFIIHSVSIDVASFLAVSLSSGLELLLTPVVFILLPGPLPSSADPRLQLPTGSKRFRFHKPKTIIETNPPQHPCLFLLVLSTQAQTTNHRGSPKEMMDLDFIYVFFILTKPPWIMGDNLLICICWFPAPYTAALEVPSASGI